MDSTRNPQNQTLLGCGNREAVNPLITKRTPALAELIQHPVSCLFSYTIINIFLSAFYPHRQFMPNMLNLWHIIYHTLILFIILLLYDIIIIIRQMDF